MKGNGAIEFGAHARIRTGDLFLTKEMVCTPVNCGGLADSCAPSNGHKMVRQWLQT